jgi:hypothetical protein
VSKKWVRSWQRLYDDAFIVELWKLVGLFNQQQHIDATIGNLAHETKNMVVVRRLAARVAV